MQKFLPWQRWWSMRQRERALALARYLWSRFLQDRCFETAGALSYTTVFALVPLTAVSLAVLSAFPVFERLTEGLTDFVFSYFVPDAARAVESYLLDFARGAGGLTMAGVSALLVAAALTLAGIETTFNRIWRVPQPRPPLMRLLVYWSLLTLGTLLLAVGFGLTSYFIATSLEPGMQTLGLAHQLLRVLPMFITVAAFTLAFVVVPNRKVGLRHALAGAALAAVLFELARFGLALYLRTVPTYQQLYGALAVIPIFLLWVYLSWVSILLGASLAASLSGFRFQPRMLRLPEGFELYGMLRLLGRFRDAQRDGEVLHLTQIHELEPFPSDDQLHEMLQELAERKIIRRDEDGGWMLARDLRHLPFSELYDASMVRIPMGEVVLPGMDDRIGRAAAAGLKQLQAPLHDAGKLPLGQLIADTSEEPTQ